VIDRTLNLNFEQMEKRLKRSDVADLGSYKDCSRTTDVV